MKEGIVLKGRVVLLFCFGFIVGTGVFSFGQIIPEIWCFALGIICVCIFILVNHYKFKIFSTILILSAGFWLAGWRYSLSYPVIDSEHISFYNGQERVFTGVVNQEPIIKKQGQQLTVFTEQGKVLVNTSLFPSYQYGDQLEITCSLEAPTNKDFLYDRYLARFGIYSLCSRPFIRVLSSNQGNYLYQIIFKIKQSAYQIAQKNLPEPEASLALPVVFGGGQDIDIDITEEFRRTGLTHIMAVSGFNVSLLTVLIGLGLHFLGLNRRLIFYITSFLVLAYVIMVGAPASAVRAGVMSIFLLLAITVGRLVSIPRSLVLVATVTLIINPRVLRDDIGWQLSFLALFGLIYLQPWLAKAVVKITNNRGKIFFEGLTATIAAQVATSPVIVYNFGNFSFMAPIANLLVVWVVPLLTICMMTALGLTAIFPSVGPFVFFPCWLMVKYIFFVVQSLSGLSWAAVEIK
jgi:competence protein ComEC